MHEVLVNRLGGLSLPRKSVVRLTDRPDMTLDVYRGRKTTIQQDLITLLIFMGIPSCFLVTYIMIHTGYRETTNAEENKNATEINRQS